MFNLTINGEADAIDVAPNTPLLWVINVNGHVTVNKLTLATEVGAASANAIFAATGAQVRSLPIKTDKVKAAM